MKCIYCGSTDVVVRRNLARPRTWWERFSETPEHELYARYGARWITCLRCQGEVPEYYQCRACGRYYCGRCLPGGPVVVVT